MSGQDSRSDRDLLIRLETQFLNMNQNFEKFDRKLGQVSERLDTVVRDIRSDLKNDYVSKSDFQRLLKTVEEIKQDIEDNYTSNMRFEPVEVVYKDVSKRVRTLLITAGICVLIAAASIPTWLAVTKGNPVMNVAPQVGAVK